MTEDTVLWLRYPVRVTDAMNGSFSDRDFYRAWRERRPAFDAYGATITEAVTALLNREEDEQR